MQDKLKVTRAQLQEIYPQVCRAWQNRIKQVLEGNLFGDFFEVGRELIQEARNSTVSPDQKAWLDRVFPKPVLEVGKWYKHTFKMGERQEDGYMLFLFEGEFGFDIAKGFYHTASGGEYGEDITVQDKESENYILATSEEILNAFRKEAKKRGLVPTVDVLCLADGLRFTIGNVPHPIELELLTNRSEFWLKGQTYGQSLRTGVCVYKDGVWADPYQECVPEGSEMENTCNEEAINPEPEFLKELILVAKECRWDRNYILMFCGGRDEEYSNLRDFMGLKYGEGFFEKFEERYKPKEPTYRPFTYEEAVEQLLGKVVKHKSVQRTLIIQGLGASGAAGLSYKQLLKDFTFQDGSPVGIKEN